MDWKDKRYNAETIFDDLYIGDVYVAHNTIYIKITDDSAFDVCNDNIESVDARQKVEKRKATLVLD